MFSLKTFLIFLLLGSVFARNNFYNFSRRILDVDLPNERIVNGVIAAEGYRKGLAQIYYKDIEDGLLYSLCSGTILGKRWVLTAAHCVEFEFGGEPFVPSYFKFGVIPAAKFANLAEVKNHGIQVKNIWVHKKYRGGAKLDYMNFDIAVLELTTEIPESRYKKVILSKPPQDNTTVVAAGYGFLNMARENATHAMTTDMVYRKFEFCKKQETETGKLAPSGSRMLCAVSKNWPTAETGVCYGDSGGPLFLKTGGEHLYQFASLSYSLWGCASYGTIDWFVRVVKYKWEVQQLLGGNSIVFKLYRRDNL